MVPKDFPYFHVQWMSKGLPAGGFAHVVEDDKQFPRSFGVDVLLGMLGDDPARFNKKGTRKSIGAQRQMVKAFLADWKPFDWTSQLDGGEYREAA